MFYPWWRIRREIRMFVLTLTITDPDDAGYFTNKTLNKLHGYIRHSKIKLALFFNLRFIKIYASEKSELEELLKNEAVCFDIKRHIFESELTAVTDSQIKVYRRMRDTIDSVKKKTNKRVSYCKKKYNLDKDSLIEKKNDLLKYYEKKQKQQKDRSYFIIKNKQKRFTVWVEPRLLQVDDFKTTQFNSYGLIYLPEESSR